MLAALVGNGPAAASALERLRKVALDGAATIRRVQEFSGTRRNRDFERVDLARLVSVAADELRARAPAGLRLDVTAAIRRPVAGNSEELGELIRVLVDNAVEAMPEGGHLSLALAAAGEDAVTLTVADSGAGMSSSVRRRALDPFFTTKGSGKKGLGLALAYGVVTRHGGRIELDSQPGRRRQLRPGAPAGRARRRSRAARPAVAAAPARHRRRTACSSSRTTPTTARR